MRILEVLYIFSIWCNMYIKCALLFIKLLYFLVSLFHSIINIRHLQTLTSLEQILEEGLRFRSSNISNIQIGKLKPKFPQLF